MTINVPFLMSLTVLYVGNVENVSLCGYSKKEQSATWRSARFCSFSESLRKKVEKVATDRTETRLSLIETSRQENSGKCFV